MGRKLNFQKARAKDLADYTRRNPTPDRDYYRQQIKAFFRDADEARQAKDAQKRAKKPP